MGFVCWRRILQPFFPLPVCGSGQQGGADLRAVFYLFGGTRKEGNALSSAKYCLADSLTICTLRSPQPKYTQRFLFYTDFVKKNVVTNYKLITKIERERAETCFS